MAHDLKVTNVVVESDCIEAVKLLDGKNYDGDQFKKLITEIWKLTLIQINWQTLLPKLG